MTYYFAELQNENSVRKAEVLQAHTLISAKAEATRRAIFRDTVLVVGVRVDDAGFIRGNYTASIKRPGECWSDYDV